MRPHTIQNTEIPNPTLDTVERFRRFVRGIVSVPKVDADREEKKSRSSKLAKGSAKKVK